ncbi:SRPBCC family protein [Kibdelosporangium lantanae]
MKLTNEVHIERDPAEVFATLLDVERVATCMPGSRLLGKVDDSTYEGEVKVKIGPLGVAYTGTVRFLEVDQEARTAVLRASGREQHGQGNADAHVTARVVPDGTGAKVAIETDLMIRGKVAQFGRGVIGEVSQKLIGQFAGNMEQLLTSKSAPTGSSNGTATTPSPGLTRPDPEPVRESELDGLALVAKPLLKRFAPVAAGLAAGLLLGGVLRRRQVIEVVVRLAKD